MLKYISIYITLFLEELLHADNRPCHSESSKSLNLRILHERVQYLAMPKLFWIIVTIADLWKELGWNSIIFLAAIAGISQELYEAATVDGAGRFKKMLYITIPGIMPTFVVYGI
jgi:ABC-type polysaccharide transport system permease subunit